MTRAYTNITIFLILVSSTLCDSYRILGVFPFPFRSHYFLASSLMRGLAEAGHDVTFITPFSDKNLFVSSNNGNEGSLREVLLDGLSDKVGQFKSSDGGNRLTQMILLNALNMISTSTAEKTLEHPNVQNLINSGEKFDAVIVTELMMDSLKGLSAHFNSHLIGFCNHQGMIWMHQYTGTPILPSFGPNIFFSFPERMNFFQRFTNAMLYLALKLNDVFYVKPVHRELNLKYFPNNPELDDIVKNISLMLVNSQTGSLFYAQPKVPITVEVGGLHVRPPRALPPDLQRVMDEAKDGVIYFSMGSIITAEYLPTGFFQTLMKVFSKRKEKVLFKCDLDTLPDKPDNVQLGKWFPQQEILAHPNMKVFVTHGGLLSTTETIYHGVPMFALPVAADQKINAVRANHDGFGVSVDLEDLTEETFGTALQQIISNPSYHDTAKQKSAILRDRRHQPIDEAVYWVEYVIRHKGAKHLRVAYVDMPWYQFYLLDVLAVTIGAILALLFLIKRGICFIMKRFKRRDRVSKIDRKMKKS